MSPMVVVSDTVPVIALVAVIPRLPGTGDGRGNRRLGQSRQFRHLRGAQDACGNGVVLLHVERIDRGAGKFEAEIALNRRIPSAGRLVELVHQARCTR